jgi:hypothetical protein
VRSLWFGPEEIEILASALDAVLRTLGLDRDDPATQVIAKRIIDLACLGELDPVRLRDHALEINRPSRNPKLFRARSSRLSKELRPRWPRDREGRV